MRAANARFCVIMAVSVGFCGVCAAQEAADEAGAKTTNHNDAAIAKRCAALMQRGAGFLVKTQDQQGGWATDTGPGVTAICTRALLLTPGVDAEHEAVQGAVAFVMRNQRDDGGIYVAGGSHKNYETSVAVSMLSVLRDKLKDDAERERVTKTIEAAREFLIENQWDEDEHKSLDDEEYGGAGYGRHKRPDLSNTNFMLEALHDSGLPKDHPTYQKALVFIQRCQMRGESNTLAFAKGSAQGGFIYTPFDGGESKAGTITIDGREELRSYGSMTYAGLKSMIYAGLTSDDPRVLAAVDWMGRHWTLEFNPNMPEQQSRQGLYYYYMTFGRALAALGEPVIVDSIKRKHDWRREFIEKLAKLQRDDGSWINEEDRWYEGFPALTTAYALIGLDAAATMAEKPDQPAAAN